MLFTPPIKVVFSGDRSACQNYIKFAANQLSILERQMSFQNLNQGRRVISPYPWLTVECLSSFGRKEVRIHVSSFVSSSVTKQAVVTENVSVELPEMEKLLIYACGTQLNTFNYQKIQLVDVPPTDRPLSKWAGELLDYGDPIEAYPIPELQPEQFLQLRYAKETITLEDFSEADATYTIALAGDQGFSRVRVTVAVGSTVDPSQVDLAALLELPLPEPGYSSNATVQLTDGLHVSVFDYVSYSSIAAAAEVSANFNSDKSKLYIFNAVIGMVYTRQVIDRDVSYVLSNSFTITPPETIVSTAYGRYVDSDGVAHLGYSRTLGANPNYDPILVDDYYPSPNPLYLDRVTPLIYLYTYWTVDLDTESFAEGTLKTNGTTIVNGALAPIEWEVASATSRSYFGGFLNVKSGFCDTEFSLLGPLVGNYKNRFCSGSEYEIVLGEPFLEATGLDNATTDGVTWTGTEIDIGPSSPYVIGALVSTDRGDVVSWDTVDWVKSDPTYTFNLPKVISPISINDSQGYAGFLIRDNNTSKEFANGITIAGVYHTPYTVELDGNGDKVQNINGNSVPILDGSGYPTYGALEWRIEVNGIQAQDTVFYDETIDGIRIRNCLFLQTEFKHLGFLF